MIRTDRGMEFRSKEVKIYLRDQHIHHFYALNTETKANYSERLINRYMMKNRTERYVDVLQDVVYRSLGDKPSAITKNEEGESRLQQYLLRQTKSQNRFKKNTKYKFKKGQTVCVSHVKSLFDRDEPEIQMSLLNTGLKRF